MQKLEQFPAPFFGAGRELNSLPTQLFCSSGYRAKEARTARARNDESHEFAEKMVSRHSRQTFFQESAGRQIAGNNAGQVDGRAVLLMEFPESVIAVQQDRRTSATGGVQTQGAEISHAHGLAIDESLAGGNTTGGDDAAVFHSDDGAMLRTLKSRGREKARFALQGQGDGTGHGIFAEKATERRVLRRRSECNERYWRCAAGCEKSIGLQ